MNKTRLLNGYIRAVSDNTHPLQTRLRLKLTDFGPNDNRQGVPIDEKERLIESALFMPLKIDFDGDKYYGHQGAIAIGPITDVREDVNEENQPILVGDAIIWNELYPDISEHLKSAFAEGISTSWEIYFQNSEIDANGIEWLHGCVFAGTCIVETPAYGPERTRIMAIAEKLTEKERSMPQENNTSEAGSITIPAATLTGPFTITTGNSSIYTGINLKSSGTLAVSELDTLRDEVVEAYRTIFNSEDLDQANASTYLSEIVQRFTDLNDQLSNVQAELTSIKEAEAQREAEAARKEKLNTRRKYLSDKEIKFTDEEWTSRETFIDTMSDDMFTTYAEDMARSLKSAKSERKSIRLPEPQGSANYTVKDLAKEFKKI